MLISSIYLMIVIATSGFDESEVLLVTDDARVFARGEEEWKANITNDQNELISTLHSYFGHTFISAYWGAGWRRWRVLVDVLPVEHMLATFWNGWERSS
jgi:hypothetical protein